MCVCVYDFCDFSTNIYFFSITEGDGSLPRPFAGRCGVQPTRVGKMKSFVCHMSVCEWSVGHQCLRVIGDDGRIDSHHCQADPVCMCACVFIRGF